MKLLSCIFLFLVTATFSDAKTIEEIKQKYGKNYQIYKVSDDEVYLYKEPKSFEFLLNAPRDYVQFGKQAFRLEHWQQWSIITGSTLLLLPFDQDLVDEAQRFGRRLGLGNSDKTTAYLKIGDLPIFRGPSDVGSAMYFLGDGWTHLGCALGFYVAGLVGDDNRALQTASQIAQGMVTTGIATQFLKHVTGRESPYVSTRDGGRWIPFPNQAEYHKNVPHYDAFPSGHIATAMMTVTVIAENYPEYTYIRPVGYSLMTLLMYQMMNNGVHWASDYPLGIAIGYLFGKVAADNGKKVIPITNESKQTSWIDKINVTPGVDYYRGFTVGFTYPIY